MLYPNTNLSPITFLQLNTVQIFCDFFFLKLLLAISEQASIFWVLRSRSVNSDTTDSSDDTETYLPIVKWETIHFVRAWSHYITYTYVILSKVTFFYPCETILNQLTSFDTAGTPIKSEVQSHQQNRVYVTATLITRIWEGFLSEGFLYRISHIAQIIFFSLNL